MKYRVVHSTEYSYPQPVLLAHNETHLTPRSAGRQRVQYHQIEVDPSPNVVTEREDFFGNSVMYFSLEAPHSYLRVTATTELEIDRGAGQLNLQSSAPWEETAARVRQERTKATLDARQYLLESPMAPLFGELEDYADQSFAPGCPVAEAVHDLMQRIHVDFTFDPGFTSVATPLAHVFEHRRGVCQDFAHLAIACLRAKGQPARYVSGYIETVPPPGKEKLVGSDASHAWFSVFDPDAGWLDFDPTNNQIPMDQHITTAWGRDYSDITPLKGVVFGGGVHSTTVAVDVHRLEQPLPALS